jgi:hypothetical protein
MEEILGLPIGEVRQRLKECGLNESESSTGVLYRRYWLFKALGRDALEFDLGTIEATLHHAEEWFTEDLARSFVNREELNIAQHPAALAVYTVYNVLYDFIQEIPGVLHGATSKQKLIALLGWMKSVICDFRPRSHRQANVAINFEKRTAVILGYTIEDTYTRPFEDLLKIMKDEHGSRGSLYRKEYETNEAHLRSNMRALIQRVKRLLRFQDRTEAKFPHISKLGITLEKALDEIQIVAPKQLGEIENALGLQDTELVKNLGDDLYILFQYEKILERVEKYIVAVSEQNSKSKISIVEVHDSLPKLTDEVPLEQYSLGSSVYVDPTVVVCKISHVGEYATIREIGLRCDGAYFLGRTLAEENLEEERDDSAAAGANLFAIWRDRVVEAAFHLQWHPTEEGREGGQYINTVFSQPIKGQVIHTLYMPLGGESNHELFHFEVQKSALLSKHKNWITCPSSPKDIDASGIIFRRFVMQINFTSDKVDSLSPLSALLTLFN